MLATEIKKRVIAHYKDSTEPLLLSKFGKTLRVEGIWPVENETRSLREVIEELKPAVDVIRDPKALAYAIVVAKGYEPIANAAIKARHDSAFLENLPRPVVLAFIARTPSGENVYLQIRGSIKYYVSSDSDGGDGVLVDDEFRMPGLYLDKVRDLAPDARTELAENIRKWAAKHDISLDSFYRRDHAPNPRSEVRPSVDHHSEITGTAPSQSALVRLQAAQLPGIAEKMVIPLDIALALSRIP